MANLSKKWGAVIGCWCVALVLIVTGICLGLTVPSSAADETVLTIICGDQTVSCAANDFVMSNGDSNLNINDLLPQFGDAITENTVTVKLLADLKVTYFNYSGDSDSFADASKIKIVFDLNGHKLESLTANLQIAASSFTLTDSNPEVTRYFRYLGMDEDNYYNYEFYDWEPSGIGLGNSYDEIKGGILACGMYNYGINISSGEMVINGGNLLGNGLVMISQGMMEENQTSVGQLTLNGGKLLVYTQGGSVGLTLEKPTCLLLADVADTECVVINGGTFFGYTVEVKDIMSSEGPTLTTIEDLATSQYVKFGDGVALDSQEVNGVKVYTVVDATTDQPITTPTEPIKTTEPANNNGSMIGIIVLGAATVVMLAGVGAAIGIAVKRRKRKAA